MNEFIKNTSVPLSSGGDSHFHAWDNGRGFTATTRLPGGFVDHQNFRFQEINGQRTPACPEVLKHF